MKIAAKNAQEFIEIEEKLKELPSIILKRVDLVEKNTIGIVLTILDDYQLAQIIHIPSFTTQIKHYGNSIIIYAKDFVFKIDNENILKRDISYLLV